METAAVPIEAGLAQQPHGQSGLSGAGFANKQDVVGAAEEVQPGKRLDLRLTDPGLPVEGESVERPAPRQTRLSEPISEAAFLPRSGFLAEQSPEQLRSRDRLALGAFDLGIERLGHAVQTQLSDQGSQLVTHRHRPWRPA